MNPFLKQQKNNTLCLDALRAQTMSFEYLSRFRLSSMSERYANNFKAGRNPITTITGEPGIDKRQIHILKCAHR